MQDTILSADTNHYIIYTFPGQAGDGKKNYEQGKNPAATAMPLIAAREEGWMQTYNELYAAD